MKDTWEQYWRGTGHRRIPDLALDREYRGFYWTLLEPRLLELHGRIEGLRTIEVGSGMGVLSLLLGLRGARPTLVDFSPGALAAARDLFSRHGVRAEYVEADLLRLPEAFFESYDVTLSLGTGEHFEDQDRRRFWEVHWRLLRCPGLLFASVPNANCLPYRLFDRLSRMAGRWDACPEVPYSRSDIRRVFTDLGLENSEVVGSPFFKDCCYFLLGGGAKAMGGLLLSLVPGGRSAAGVERRKRLYRYVDRKAARFPDWRSPCDDRWGYGLVAVATRV